MKWNFIIFICLLMVSLVSANTVYQQNSEIDLKISCTNVNCSQPINITIFYPNSSTSIDNELTTNNSGYVNYTFSHTSTFGEYIFITDNGYEDTFTITPSGSLFTPALSIPIFLPMFFMLLIALFFFFLTHYVEKKEYRFTFLILGAIFLIFTISFGIIASRDVLYEFPLLYSFINSFYNIFIITLQVSAIVVPVIAMFLVVKRAFNSRGYNI